MIILPYYVWEREPHPVPLGIVEPGTRLPVYVDHQIEYQLEETQGQLDVLGRVQESYDFGETQNTHDL